MHEPQRMFQFPSNGKAYPKWTMDFDEFCREDRFQFPSNGKAYPKPQSYQKNPQKISFNSLQTGRHIQSCCCRFNLWYCCGSFQFPSNGKAYPKWANRQSASICWRVSIPFKREGISKAMQRIQLWFKTVQVSIPFKREGISKGIQLRYSAYVWPTSFNSLQTGRHIQSY